MPKKPTTKVAKGLSKLGALRDELTSMFVERDREIDALLLALVAREHVLLLGPPGTAKSLVTRTVTQAVTGATYFERLLTKFSPPEELFGPFSLKGLEQDTYRRITDGQLPEAHVAFVDEVFKANAAILNSLLTILNERVFHNGNGSPVDCPLLSMVGCSNELPDGPELAALYDRFMLRIWTGYISDPDSRRSLLRATIRPPKNTLTLQELKTLQDAVDSVVVPEAVEDSFLAIWGALDAASVIGSDRRWRAAIRLVKARALLRHDPSSADPPTAIQSDLLVIADIMWSEPDKIAQVRDRVGQVAAPALAEALGALDAAKSERASALAAAPSNLGERSSRMQYVDTLTSAQAAVQEMQTQLTVSLVEHNLHVNPGPEIQRVLDELGGILGDLGQRAADLVRVV